MLTTIINYLKWLSAPVYMVAVALITVVSVILGAIINPSGAINTLICTVIDIVVFFFPSTPNDLKISSLLTAFSSAVPLVGWGIVLDIMNTCFTMLAILLIIKVYKLIPFKST